MPLKITLKPKELILIGGALLRNGDHLAQFTVENEVPILRQKDLLTKQIYYVIQLMYFEPARLTEHHQVYWQFVRTLSRAAPSTLPLIDEIGEEILQGRYYRALKATRKLIAYEANLTRHAHERATNVQQDPEGHALRA